MLIDTGSSVNNIHLKKLQKKTETIKSCEILSKQLEQNFR